MWRVVVGDPLPPFLNLLHETGLAYQLFGDGGVSIGASLVPALLSDLPMGFHKLPVELHGPSHWSDAMTKLFIPDDVVAHSAVIPTLTLTFPAPLPITFLGQLQVALSHMAMMGGAWKNGCALRLATTKGVSYAIGYLEVRSFLAHYVFSTPHALFYGRIRLQIELIL